MSVAEIDPTWIEAVRTIIRRDGYASRAPGDIPIIQIKNMSTNAWQPLGLPSGSIEFVAFEDRNAIYKAIVG